MLKESSNIQELCSEPPIIPLDVALPEDVLPVPAVPSPKTSTQKEEQVVRMGEQNQVVDENAEQTITTLTAPPTIILPPSQSLTPRRPLDNKCLKKLLDHLVRVMFRSARGESSYPCQYHCICSL